MRSKGRDPAGCCIHSGFLSQPRSIELCSQCLVSNPVLCLGDWLLSVACCKFSSENWPQWRIVWLRIFGVSRDAQDPQQVAFSTGRGSTITESSILYSSVQSLTFSKVLELCTWESRRKRGCHWIRWLDGITDAMDMNLGKLWEMGRDREAWVPCNPWGCKELDMTGQLNKNKELCFYSLPTFPPKYDVSRQLKTSGRLEAVDRVREIFSSYYQM